MSDFNIQFEEQDQSITLEFEQIGGGAVKSVNGKTGVVVLDADDVGAYTKPSGGIPASDIASGVIPTVDSTLAISGAAADAKKTGDEIATVKDGLETVEALTITNEQEQVTNPTVTESRYVRYLPAKDQWQELSSASFHTAEFAVKENTKYRIINASTYSPFVPAIVYYNGTTIIGSTEVPTETTYTGTKIPEMEIVTPSGCTKILANDFIGVLANTISDVYELKTQNIYNEIISENTFNIRNSEEETPYESVVGAVAWNGSTLQLRSNGAYEGWTTKKYRVEVGAKYHVRGTYFTTNPIAAYVDGNGALTPVWNNPEYSQYSVKAYEVDIVVPSGIKEIWVSMHNDWSDRGAYMWGYHKSFQAKFADITWYCLGDSLTEYNATASKKYYSFVQDHTGIIPIIDGVGGSGYINPASGNNQFYNRALNIPNNVDVITIFGSGNDVSSYTLGEVTDTGTETICGCINTTIDNIYSVNPVAKIGIVTPCPWRSFPTSTDNKMSKYAAALVEICRLRGIPCLDLYRCSGFRPWDDDFRLLAYTFNNSDGVHPNNLGNEILASHFESFLGQLICAN